MPSSPTLKAMTATIASAPTASSALAMAAPTDRLSTCLPFDSSMKGRLGFELQLPSQGSPHRVRIRYRASCRSCSCGNGPANGAHMAPASVARPLPFADHPDAAFQQHCHVNLSVTPPNPRALYAITWFHVPKAASSVTTLLYNYACRDTSETRLISQDPAVASNRTVMSLSSASELATYQDRTCSVCWDTSCSNYPYCGHFTIWV